MSDQSEARNWLELPRDITPAIFSKLPTSDLLSLQCVCSPWRNISKDPSYWRSIYFRNSGDRDERQVEAMCKRAIDLSNGGLVEITIQDFGTADELVTYIADRSRHLKRLRLISCLNISFMGLGKAAAKLSELEELEISYCKIPPPYLDAVGNFSTGLKSFKFNNNLDDIVSDRSYDNEDDETALIIAQYMENLNHLQLVGNNLTNFGLQAILKCCPRLEFLDLRHCFNVKLQGKVEKRCSKQIKHLRRPRDAIQDYEYYGNYHKTSVLPEDDLSGYSDDPMYHNYGYGFGVGPDGIFSPDHFDLHDPFDVYDDFYDGF